MKENVKPVTQINKVTDQRSPGCNGTSHLHRTLTCKWRTVFDFTASMHPVIVRLRVIVSFHRSINSR